MRCRVLWVSLLQPLQRLTRTLPRILDQAQTTAPSTRLAPVCQSATCSRGRRLVRFPWVRRGGSPTKVSPCDPRIAGLRAANHYFSSSLWTEE